MNDFYIFCFGLLVSLVVASAVGLLLWGAANEPRGSILPAQESDPLAPSSRTSLPAPAAGGSMESKSPA